MVWMLARYENHDWDAMEAKVPILWDQLNNHMASGNGVPGKWATKAQEWLQNYHQRKWWKLQQLHEWWTLDSTLRADIANPTTMRPWRTKGTTQGSQTGQGTSRDHFQACTQKRVCLPASVSAT